MKRKYPRKWDYEFFAYLGKQHSTDYRKAVCLATQRCFFCGGPTYGYGLLKCKKCIRRLRRGALKSIRKGHVRLKAAVNARRQWLMARGVTWQASACMRRHMPLTKLNPDGSVTVIGMLPISVPVVVERLPSERLPQIEYYFREVEASDPPPVYGPPISLDVNLGSALRV